MAERDVKEVVSILKSGDIILTKNPDGLGKAINFFQRIEEGDKSEFGHVAIVINNPETGEVDGTIIESVKTISINHISDYSGNTICVMRHTKMCLPLYRKGLRAVMDNKGQVYPFHRLFVHCYDACASWLYRKLRKKNLSPQFKLKTHMPLDWAVCSELGAQFMIATGLETGLAYKGWRGTNPDHFDDARQRRIDLWVTVFKGMMTE